MRRLPCIALIASVAAAGCARTYAPSTSVYDFPSPAELARVERSPMPTPIFGEDTVAVEEWALEGPFPEPGRAPDPLLAEPSEWDSVVEGARGRGLEMRPEARCAARELGRFLLEHGGMPTRPHERFVLARCGVHAAEVARVVELEVAPPDLPAEELRARWGVRMTARLLREMREGTWIGGIWFGRDAHRAAAVAVAARPDIVFSRDSPKVSEAGRVRIRGRVLREVAHVDAYVNQGERGFARCTLDERLTLPDFQLECRLAEGDDHALVQVGVFEEGRVLGRTEASLLAVRPGARAATFTPAPLPPSPGPPPEDTGLALVDGVNRARVDAGLVPLRREPGQSELARRLAPGFFAAATGRQDPERMDLIAVGLLAGHRVRGTIRNGSFTANAVPGRVDARRWLADALSQPTGRRALLSPQMRAIAVGTVRGDDGGLGALVTTYAFFDRSADPESAANRAIGHIATERVQRGLAPPTLVTGFESFEDEVRRMRRDGKAPGAVMDAVLARAVDDFGRSMRGWVIETGDPERFDLAPGLLEPGPLYLMIEATHHRPSGAPWGQWVIFVLTPD